MASTHRIRRQSWQVSAPDAGTAFALRTYLRQAQDTDLLPALERAFEALDTGGQTIRIPRLSVSLRTGPSDWGSQLPEQLFEAVALALQTAVADTRTLPDQDSVSAEGGLAHYLVSGQLPWFAAAISDGHGLSDLQQEAQRWSQVPTLGWERLQGLLPPTVAGRQAVFFRFLQLLDDEGRAVWLRFMTERALTLDLALGEQVDAMVALSEVGAPEARLHVLALGLGWLADSGLLADWPALVDTRLPEAPASPTASAARVLLLRQSGSNALPAASASPVSADGTSPIDTQSVVVANQAPFENSSIFPVDRNPALGLPVSACGLVILHPYLPRLFAGLGWLPEHHPRGDPFPESRRPQAAALLHWLATGRTAVYEFELPLIKVLLGLQPDDPLPVGEGLLDAATCEEGTALLAAALSHWPALGNTSVDGLRVAFLQRAGLLYPAPAGWLLRPQAETYDILLDRLPWGISIIRLPWMATNLHTEWTPH